MDDPISLRQRLWLDFYLGQDLSACGSPAQAGWIRGFASARADARLPVLLANGIFLLGPVTIEGVLIPKPEVNKFSLPDSPWEPEGLKNLRKMAESGEIILASKEEPDTWFEDAELAFRVSTFQ
jgi:hypothetical protein